MNKIKVLFVCIHNSARSQMAEAFMNKLAGDRYLAESAGIEPGKLNPLVVRALSEVGIDISGNKTKTVRYMIDAEKTFDYVITVCDETSAERCPVVPGGGKRIHWSFEDPSAMEGTEEEKTQKIRVIRDEIKNKIIEFTSDLSI